MTFGPGSSPVPGTTLMTETTEAVMAGMVAAVLVGANLGVLGVVAVQAAARRRASVPLVVPVDRARAEAVDRHPSRWNCGGQP